MGSMSQTPPATTEENGSTTQRTQLALAAAVVLMMALLQVQNATSRLGLRPSEQQPIVLTSQVNLNHADRAELLQLPGVGPNMADAILAYRDRTGGFRSVDDLQAVRGVGAKTINRLKPYLTTEMKSASHPRQRPVELLTRKEPAPQKEQGKSQPVRNSKLKPGDPPLDINAASETELQRLPGIGPTLSKRIVEAREDRPFSSVEDLRRVKGIGPKTLENLKPFVECTDPS